MGNCLCSGSQSVTSTSTTINHANSGISHTTSNTSSSKTSNYSSKSPFSVSSGDENYPDGHILPIPNLRRFSFQELKTAARNFKPDTLLGEGGFGKVYRGWLDERQQPYKSGSGTLVAIKKLNPESMQGFEEWQTEIDFLGRLSHPNLVKLLGYCLEESELLLVYEFMQRGSLENHLFGRGCAVQPLPWELRIKIAIGAARGLAFLHASDDRVIYRDIKAANILLDGVYNAKISDFGLAKSGPSASQSHITTRVMGSHGYAAPEYVATGHLYVKSDVYGFGVVLVELLTGLRALDPNRPDGQKILADWIQPHLSEKRKLKAIMDTRLGKYPSKASMETAKLALNCLAQEPKSRPSMKEVLDSLEQIQAIGESERETPNKPARRASRHTKNG